MGRLLIIAALACAACERQPQQGEATPAGGGAGETLSTKAQSKPPAVVPRPADQAKLDDLILAGYTPHADHLHPPGVNACPLTKGSDAVM